MTRYILSAACGVAALALPAFAEPPSDMKTRTVDYSGMDLYEMEDAEQLYRKIKSAARDVCDHRSGRMPLSERRAINACVEDAMVRAIRDISMDTVAEVHHRRTGDRIVMDYGGDRG